MRKSWRRNIHKQHTGAPSAAQEAVAIPACWRGLSICVMAVVLLGLYWRLVAGWVLAGGDLHTYFFPYWAAATRAFQAGTLPLWNPYLFAGAPLLANSQVGIFYPLNWPFWWISGTSLASAAWALHWSVLVHLILAAVNASVLARRLGAKPWSAALAGFLYAGSGYLGVHIEHLNQLQGLAWLPLVLLPSTASAIPAPVTILALALILLAGHTQMAFIAVLGLAVWRLTLWLLSARDTATARAPNAGQIHPVLGFGKAACRLVFPWLPFVLSGLIAAVQLLPVFELARFSTRAGGLPWREAVSFSISPLDLPRALLPPYLFPPLLPEGVAYLGGLGMLLAGIGVWLAFRLRNPQGIALAVLAVTGLFLALGGYNPLYLAAVRMRVPGLVHFRAPARFLALYILAASILAALALSWLDELRAFPFALNIPRVAYILAGLGVIIELFVCAERLPHARATVPRAYTDLRPATAHLVAATQASEAVGQPPGRFLSISQMLFDPGDKVEIEEIYGPHLSPDALWAYLISAKAREVLSPNLSLAFKVYAVDGYDGGLLPLRHYIDFSRLLLPGGTTKAGAHWLDGRLRENLSAIPDERWLSLLGVRFLITDKTGDAWADGIFYDRQFQPTLVPGETLTLGWLPPAFEANALGLLYQGAGQARIALADGRVLALPFRAAGAQGAPARLRWSPPSTPVSITVRATSALSLTGASLIDERVAAFYPLVLSEHFRLGHSGDVKIYENMYPLPRAFLVHRCVALSDTADILDAMADPSFDPAAQVALYAEQLAEHVDNPAAHCEALAQTPLPDFQEQVEVVAYQDTHIVLHVHAEAPAFVVLAESWYPGWAYRVAPCAVSAPPLSTGDTVLQADMLFRSVYVPRGDWCVTYTYRAQSLIVGAWVSVTGICLFVAYVILHCFNLPFRL